MPNDALSRRRFLTTGLVTAATATALAGCLGGSEGGDDAEDVLTLVVSPHDGPLRERHVVDLAETRPEWDEEAFEAARDGSRYTTQYRKPFSSTPEGPTYAKSNGTYYRLGSVVVDEVVQPRPVLRLRDASDDDAGPTGDVIAADRLPPGDQRAVRIAHLAARARGNEGGVPWGLVQRGGYVYRQDDDIEASRLLAEDGPDEVRYRETRYAVEVATEPFYEPVYRATVVPVATSPEQMEAILRATFVDSRIVRDELSREARDVLREARGDGYSEPHPYSAGFRAVLTALHERAYLDGDIENDDLDRPTRTSLLMYDGEYYTYRLRFRSASS